MNFQKDDLVKLGIGAVIGAGTTLLLLKKKIVEKITVGKEMAKEKKKKKEVQLTEEQELGKELVEKRKKKEKRLEEVNKRINTLELSTDNSRELETLRREQNYLQKELFS